MAVQMRRSVALSLLVALLLPAILPQSQGAVIDPYISHPGNIPNLHNFTTPQIEPGETGKFQLQLKNRYVQPMDNVTLRATIYMNADIDRARGIYNISTPPRIRETVQDYVDGKAIISYQDVEWQYGAIEPQSRVFPGFNITTKEGTTQGTFFVRFLLEFEYNGTARIMRSRGHYTDTEWEAAIDKNNTDDNSPGNINVTMLGIDAIIPDSSFGIKDPIPRWPLYVLISLTVFFGFLAVIFYLEEEGTYPQLNKWLQQQRGKFEQLRLVLEHRRRGS